MALVLYLFTCVSFASSVEDIKKSMEVNYIEQMKNMQAIKKKNENLIKQNSIYYKNIMDAVRKYYQSYIGKNWGIKNVKLSSKKSFTQYSDDMKSRENIDFEKGNITIEVITDTKKNIKPKFFEEKLKVLKNETINQALKKDPIYKASSKYLNKMKIVSKTNKKMQKKYFLKDLIVKSNIHPLEIKEKFIKLKNGHKKKIVSVTIEMVPKYLEKLARRYKKNVLTESKNFDVTPSYVFSTIQVESSFNPLAVSPVPAYGLMQIVPSSGGKDAYFALTGKKRLLPPVYLYNSQNNIRIGTKYIQIIQKKYLYGIKNEKSLLYCTATSYNAGIGNLIVSFSGSYSKRKEAIKKINAMSSEAVYKHLVTSPKLSTEAKNYVKKIRNSIHNYIAWDIQ